MRQAINRQVNPVDNLVGDYVIVTTGQKAVTTAQLSQNAKKQQFSKKEDEAVKIQIGCIAEGVAYLLAIFYVFNMKYPVLLNGVNLFFEKIMGLSPSLRLSVSIDLNILK